MNVWDELNRIAKLEPWEVRTALLEFVALHRDEKIQVKRTTKQNNAIHLDCQLLADKLNDMGLDQRTLLKQSVDIPWTMLAVKEKLWKPFMKQLYGKESTTELKIDKEIETIHETLMRELGEKKGVEYHPFPSVENKL